MRAPKPEPRESACICGFRAPIGTAACDCGKQMYPVGSNPWAEKLQNQGSE